MIPCFLSSLCVLFIALAIPLILQKVPPNCIYGFRTRKTLSDETIWYKANKFLGYGLVISSLSSLLVFGGGSLFPQIIPPSFIVNYANQILLVPIIVLLVSCFIYLHKL
ncbi:MAG: hypothetical protein A2161_15480 [Candidatus Schekmanbacteria bacterium RBG_13_48_7]|uniref:SdpI family protein n=1 Tax=Candidatus Schekmanbacteria bacterium RBG_13_48_7 TaxID=1817878 RepID=A0A1F7S2T6_9BACT|nr:MAG: hypothetical protein A2161_15480 [Candidatus Schekmanbacteria bacterium RBG_13_48_7]